MGIYNTQIFKYICTYRCNYVCTCIYIHIYICTHMYMYMYMYVYVYVHVCVYIHTHIYVYVYIYIYIFVDILLGTAFHRGRSDHRIGITQGGSRAARARPLGCLCQKVLRPFRAHLKGPRRRRARVLELRMDCFGIRWPIFWLLGFSKGSLIGILSISDWSDVPRRTRLPQSELSVLLSDSGVCARALLVIGSEWNLCLLGGMT